MKSSISRGLLIVVTALAVGAWALVSTFSDGGPSKKEIQFILEHGVQARATLLTLERTGTVVNNIHQYAFRFRVETDSGDGFELVRKKLIDPIYMGSIKVGMDIPALTVPGNEKQTLIQWEKAGIGNAF